VVQIKPQMETLLKLPVQIVTFANSKNECNLFGVLCSVVAGRADEGDQADARSHGPLHHIPSLNVFFCCSDSSFNNNFDCRAKNTTALTSNRTHKVPSDLISFEGTPDTPVGDKVAQVQTHVNKVSRSRGFLAF
jgi:hypothetical protein